MKPFSGFGFDVSADGDLTRTEDIDVMGLKQVRGAQCEVHDFIKPLNEKARAAAANTKAPSLTNAERHAVLAVGAYADELSRRAAIVEAANEAERGEDAIEDGDAQVAARGRQLGGVHDRGSESIARPTGRLYAQMFPRLARSMGGWSSAREYYGAISQSLSDPRLRAASHSGADLSTGGALIPPGILAPLLDTSLEVEIVRSRAAVWPMETRERWVPAFDVMDRSGDDVAGMELQWFGENPDTAATPQVSKLRMLKLHARTGGIFFEASNELLRDAVGGDAAFNAIGSKAINYGLDRTFLWGNGAGRPLGVFSSGARIDVARSSAGVILYEDLLSMFSRLTPGSIPNSVWVAHSSAIPNLMTLTVPVGTGGSVIPVMTESNGQFSILTRPVIFTEKVRPVGQLSDISLNDFSQYAIGIRQEAEIEKSLHVGFLTNKTTYRILLRIDGMPVIDVPYTMPNGAPTTSPFVALAA